VEPWRLLAQMNDRDEHEYVIDPDDLKIVAVDG